MKIARVSQVILEENKLLYNKAILLRFCNHFKELNLTQLLNDKLFIQYMDNCIHKTPTLQSRAFQLALEMTYSKRKFDQITLQQCYENDFLIDDIFKINNGVCDQSTVYTALLTKNLATFLSVNKNDIIVNSTPLYLTKDKITPEIQRVMEYNKKMTGNTCPDISLMERPYDYKDTKDVSYSTNHLYLIDKKNVATEAALYLTRIERYFTDAIQKRVIPPDVVLYMESMLNIITSNKTKSSQESYEAALNFMRKTPPPKEFKVAILIYADKSTVENVPDICDVNEATKVPLDSGKLIDVKVKKAICGIIEPWSDTLKETVNKATHASLAHVLQDSDHNNST